MPFKVETGEWLQYHLTDEVWKVETDGWPPLEEVAEGLKAPTDEWWQYILGNAPLKMHVAA